MCRVRSFDIFKKISVGIADSQTNTYLNILIFSLKLTPQFLLFGHTIDVFFHAEDIAFLVI